MILCHAHRDFLRDLRGGSQDFEYRLRKDYMRYLIMMALKMEKKEKKLFIVATFKEALFA